MAAAQFDFAQAGVQVGGCLACKAKPPFRGCIFRARIALRWWICPRFFPSPISGVVGAAANRLNRGGVCAARSSLTVPVDRYKNLTQSGSGRPFQMLGICSNSISPPTPNEVYPLKSLAPRATEVRPCGIGIACNGTLLPACYFARTFADGPRQDMLKCSVCGYDLHDAGSLPRNAGTPGARATGSIEQGFCSAK